MSPENWVDWWIHKQENASFDQQIAGITRESKGPCRPGDA